MCKTHPCALSLQATRNSHARHAPGLTVRVSQLRRNHVTLTTVTYHSSVAPASAKYTHVLRAAACTAWNQPPPPRQQRGGSIGNYSGRRTPLDYTVTQPPAPPTNHSTHHTTHGHDRLHTGNLIHHSSSSRRPHRAGVFIVHNRHSHLLNHRKPGSVSQPRLGKNQETGTIKAHQHT